MNLVKSIKHRSKALLRTAARTAGFEISRVGSSQVGNSIEDDIAKLTISDAPIVIDVGSNTGQSMLAFRHSLPNSRIHCFEPGRSTFRELQSTAQSLANVTLNNCAVGQVSEVRDFFEYDDSVMNSFLKPGDQNWSKPASAHQVEVVSMDDYCMKSQISQVDLLKIDTQGHDMEVIRGASNLLKSGSVRLIMCEIIFADLYEGQPSPYEFLDLLSQNDYKLVSFYNICNFWGELGWCDVLVAHSSVLPKRPDAG
jgi:FkbM family methyltransferase